MAETYAPGLESADQATKKGLSSRLRPLFHGSRILLIAVGLVVALVSLPLLRSLAIKENELDAVRALDLLGREAFSADCAAQTVGDLLASGGNLAGRLPDTRLLAEGRVMFHHGYLFDLVDTETGERLLRAWPLSHGETGLGVFRLGDSGKLLGHPNRSAHWSGMDGAPPSTLLTRARLDGWRDVRLGTRRNSGI
jgi:hypothetical protein